VNCISQCPFEDTKNTQHIIREILYYNTLPGISEICLVDTFGGLRYKFFEQIINGVTKHMDIRKISVRLCRKKTANPYFKQYQEHNIAKIIQFCIQNNIYQFDVISDNNDDNDNDNNNDNDIVDAYKILNHNRLYNYIEDDADLASCA